MHGDLGRAGRRGAGVVLALCALSACSGAPAGEAAREAKVVEAVRVATDRSALERSTMILPSGERVQRMSLRNGFSHVVLGRKGADGRTVTSCVNSAPAAEAFLAGAAGAAQ